MGIFFALARPCLFTVDKTAFSNSGAHFWDFFQQFCNFSSISGFQYELLPYVAQNFRYSREKSILRVQAKVWQKIGFRLESVTVFHKHLDFTQKIVGLLVKKFLTFVRAAFYLPGGSFFKKNNFSKELSFSYIFET